MFPTTIHFFFSHKKKAHSRFESEGQSYPSAKDVPFLTLCDLTEVTHWITWPLKKPLPERSEMLRTIRYYSPFKICPSRTQILQALKLCVWIFYRLNIMDKCKEANNRLPIGIYLLQYGSAAGTENGPRAHPQAKHCLRCMECSQLLILCTSQDQGYHT